MHNDKMKPPNITTNNQQKVIDQMASYKMSACTIYQQVMKDEDNDVKKCMKDVDDEGKWKRQVKIWKTKLDCPEVNFCTYMYKYAQYIFAQALTRTRISKRRCKFKATEEIN